MSSALRGPEIALSSAVGVASEPRGPGGGMRTKERERESGYTKDQLKDVFFFITDFNVHMLQLLLQYVPQ